MSLLVRIVGGIASDPLILKLAIGLLTTHVVLTLVFSKLAGVGPWRSTSLFTAKQAIALSMMTVQTYWGFVYWNQDEYHAPFLDRVEDERELYQGGVFMARVVLGGLLHDIPAGFVAGGVDTMMHLHHFGMFLVASIAMGFWSEEGLPQYARYAPFFFGVIELSSIPLAIVDVFHPHKQPEWHKYHLTSSFLKMVNEIARNSFALLYICIRLVYFPKVIAGQVLQDSWLKWNHPDNAPYRLPIVITSTFSILFTLLQMYWGLLILKQIAKVFQGDNKEEEVGGKKKAKIKAV